MPINFIKAIIYSGSIIPHSATHCKACIYSAQQKTTQRCNEHILFDCEDIIAIY